MSTARRDADYLLEYILGNVKELKADGDLNDDGRLTSYDAHLLLALLEGETCVTVPSGVPVTDSDMVSPYAVRFMTWPYEIGLIRGMDDNTINPRGNSVRAQVATILKCYNEIYLSRSVAGGLCASRLTPWP